MLAPSEGKVAGSSGAPAGPSVAAGAGGVGAGLAAPGSILYAWGSGDCGSPLCSQDGCFAQRVFAAGSAIPNHGCWTTGISWLVSLKTKPRGVSPLPSFLRLTVSAETLTTLGTEFWKDHFPGIIVVGTKAWLDV